jgi:hypothetical protein
MPYTIRKAKCKQTDGDQGSYVLSYTDEKGKKHRNCHTSRKKAKGQIAAIEMPEGIEEGWVPVAARLTRLLEEELAALAGSFKLHEDGREQKLKVGDVVRHRFTGSEMMVHTRGKPQRGKILVDNEDGTYDVDWEPLDPVPPYLGSDEDEVSSEAERTVQRRVPADEIVISKARKSKKS